MTRQDREKNFLRKAPIKHNDFYNYDNVYYVDNSTKVEIGCPIHGSFHQQPNNHLQGKGCPECANIKKGNARRKPLTIIKNYLTKFMEIFITTINSK